MKRRIVAVSTQYIRDVEHLFNMYGLYQTQPKVYEGNCFDESHNIKIDWKADNTFTITITRLSSDGDKAESVDKERCSNILTVPSIPNKSLLKIPS